MIEKLRRGSKIDNRIDIFNLEDCGNKINELVDAHNEHQKSHGFETGKSEKSEDGVTFENPEDAIKYLHRDDKSEPIPKRPKRKTKDDPEHDGYKLGYSCACDDWETYLRFKAEPQDSVSERELENIIANYCSRQGFSEYTDCAKYLLKNYRITKR